MNIRGCKNRKDSIWSSLCVRTTLCLVLFFALFSQARENVWTIRSPQTFASISWLGELLDDVYSTDVGLSVEYAPCNCFSVYADASYRFLSYEFDTMLHDQRHELVDLQVNGFNESYFGAKVMPFPYFGVDLGWRIPPAGGSQTNRFHRLKISPMGLYPLSKRMDLGVTLEYFSFLEKNEFQPGDELGLKGSISWRLAWDEVSRRGWKIDYVFLYRMRLQESENYALSKPYRKMDDQYRGLRLRLDGAYYFNLMKYSLGTALFYEMNRGNLFGLETGHTLGLYVKWLLN